VRASMKRVVTTVGRASGCVGLLCKGRAKLGNTLTNRTGILELFIFEQRSNGSKVL